MAGAALLLATLGGCTTTDAPLPADELAALPGSLVFASERAATRGREYLRRWKHRRWRVEQQRRRQV